MNIGPRVAARLGTLAAALLLAGAAAGAAEPPLLTVDDPWVRATVEGQTGSGAYMRLTSRADAQLVGASSPVATTVEIHEMHTVNDMMTMRRVERLAVPAGTPVALDHDYHVMFIGLKRQLLTGQVVPITLRIVDAAGKSHAVTVRAPVRALNTLNRGADRAPSGAANPAVRHDDGAPPAGSMFHD